MTTGTRWTADRVVDAIDVLTASVTRQQELEQMIASVRAGLHRDGAESPTDEPLTGPTERVA